MSEPDGPEEAMARTGERLAGYMTLALTVAARAMEQAAHRREELARRAEQAGGEHARLVQAHLRAEAAAVRFQLRETRDPAWWDRASEEQMAHAWATARSYAGVDGELRGQARWMGEEIERRTGVAPEELWRAAEREAAAARVDQAVAVALVAEADRADLAAVRDEMAPEVGGYPMPGPPFEETATPAMQARVADARALLDGSGRPPEGPAPRTPEEWQRRGATPAGWDTPVRRQGLADRLDAAGVSPEAREARLLSDRASGTRPSEAAVPIGRGEQLRGRQAGQAPGRERRPRTPRGLGR